MLYDTVVIGGGPAGITAAIYTARKGLKIAVLTKDIGGQVAKSSVIENYTGYSEITGVDLSKRFKEHLDEFKFEFKETEVTTIKKSEKMFTVESQAGSFEAKTVIVATGAHPRLLKVPGEEEFTGRGVTYCATCDAPLFNGKEVAVVGGGNSGLEAAIQLFNFSPKIYLMHRHEKLKGDQVLVDQVEKSEKVTVMSETEITEIRGGQFVELVKVRQAGAEKELKVGGVFVNIGLTPETGLVKGLVEMNEAGEIKVDFCNNTDVVGLFAAGDCTCVPHKQIIVAGGEGCKAALSAAKYLNMAGEY